jgi:hypothetical protein
MTVCGGVILTALVLVIAGQTSAQQVITTCGESKGKAFYLQPPDGWADDGISGGSIIFMRYPDGQYDLIFKDKI